MKILLIIAACLVSFGASAQPTCLSGAPNAPACQAQAVNPQPTDIVFGQQATGPNRTNQTVKFPLSQLSGSPPGGATNTIQYSAGSGAFGGISVAVGQILIGQSSGPPTAQTPSGDCTFAASGAVTCTALNGKSVTLGGSLTTIGAFSVNFTFTGATAVTFPQSGNLAYQVGSIVGGHCLQASGTAGGVADAGAICGSGGSGITQLTGDVTAGPGSGSQAATVVNLSSVTNGSLGNSGLLHSTLTINGVNIMLGGSGTVAAAAGTLTGGSLASNVVASSLTSVGTLTAGSLGAGFTTVPVAQGGTGATSLGAGLTNGGSVLNTTLADTVHAASAATANPGGEDDYNGSSLTATLATLATGQSLTVTDQNASALTIALAGQTVVGLPLPTTLHTGGFYGFTFNSLGTISGYGFPGFGTITTGALGKFLDGSGAMTASGLTDNGATISTAENLTVTGTTTVSEVLGASNVQSSSTYTMAASDCGKTIVGTDASAATYTIPASIVPASGATCIIGVIEAGGSGKISVNGTAVSAATLQSAHSYTGTSGTQWSEITLTLSTVASATVAVLTGDGS